MMDRIVFATDFSPASRRLLGYASRLARRVGASLIGCHALKPPSSLFAQKREEREAWEKEHLGRLQSFFDAPELMGLEVRVRLGRGSPEEALLAASREEGADLLLMAKRSKTTLEKFFVGSVTERVAALSTCPILILPDSSEAQVSWNPILCPIDFSRASNRALEYAVRLSRKFGASLLILAVVEEPAQGEPSESLLRSTLKKVEETASLYGAPKDARKEVAIGKPAEQIVKKAEARASDLVIIGSRGAAQGDYVGLGSTAVSVLKRETFPLLIIPGGEA